MKLSLKLAALIIGFSALLLPFVKPQTANAATGCQLIVSTTSVVAHGSFNVTVQNGQYISSEYIIKFVEGGILYHWETFLMPASGSQSYSENLDTIFASNPSLASSGQFTITAGTTGSPGETCSPPLGILMTVIAPPTPTTTITAASTIIPYNTATTLTWTSTNADTCTLNGSSVATNGSQPTGNLITPTTFTISCTNVSGNSQSSVTVTVQPPPAPTCSPPNQSAVTGQTVNFSASAGNGTYSWSAPSGNPASGSGASFSTAYSTAGTFTVTVTSAGLNASCTATITASPPTITSLTADNPSIAWGASTTIRWTTTNASSCTLNGTTVAVNGSQPTGSLTITTTYTLNCQGPGGAAQKSVTVTVAAPIPCSYNFSPATVNINDPVTVTISSGDPTHQFFASITPGGTTGTAGPGSFPLTINLKAPGTGGNYTVAARDNVTKNLCALTGPSNTLVVNAPTTWHLSQPIVAFNQLSVLFSFTPASNGNIGLIVAPQKGGVCNWGVLPRPFDSGAIANGTGQVTWNFPPPGDYCAELVFGTTVVSDNPYVTFTVGTPPPNTWTLSINNTSGYLVVFNISPNAGGNSALLIMDSTKTTTVASLLIPLNATNMTWTGPTTASPTTYNAVINYWSHNVSNWAQFTLPVNAPATQWTLSIQNISGNNVTFNVQCPTKDCPGYGGGAVPAAVDITNTGNNSSAGSIIVPAGGGTLVPITLPNGSYRAQVNAGLKQVGSTVEFTLPQKNNCGWLNFPGSAGFVRGPVNNCNLATPGGIISAILPYVFGIAGFLSVIIIVISGIQFITSSGNPEAAASARNRLVFALIGLAFIILAFAILQIVDKLFLGGSGVS